MSSLSTTNDVLIIGAGLAGLCCAKYLQAHGRQAVILEGSDAVGGRIRTDVVDGFLLDRGFQVLLTSYPEAQTVLDYSRLQLNPFEAGSLIRLNGAFHPLVDPWRSPMKGLRSVFSPIGSVWDKARIAKVRSRVLRHPFRHPEISTRQALEEDRFSPAMIEQFFRPFLGGIFLDETLQTSSHMFEFVFRMFSTGMASLPALGMQEIPKQLAEGLPPEAIQFHKTVHHIDGQTVTLTTGEQLTANVIVLATDATTTANLLHEPSINRGWQGVTCLYFAAEQAPITEPMLLLNGDGRGPINNMCVPSLICPQYAPAKQHLISVTALGIHQDEAALRRDVVTQLTEWFGERVNTWRHLRTYSIPQALPTQRPGDLTPFERPVQMKPGVYVCGDHRDNASINGAMVSGRRAAMAILEQRV